MTAVRKLEEYGPFIVEQGKKLDIERLRRLHDTVGKYRNNFLTDHDLQDALLNGGYRPEQEEKRPPSYLDLTDAVVPRTQTLLHLLTVQHAINLVTRPQLIVAPSQELWIPGKPVKEERWTIPGGGDAQRLEDFQRQWLEDTETTTRVRAYEKALEDTFGEFNLKLILTCMYHAEHRARAPTPEARQFQEEIARVLFPEGYSILDSAYYNAARRKFSVAGHGWEEVNKTEFGKFFLLSPQQVAQGMRAMMSRN